MTRPHDACDSPARERSNMNRSNRVLALAACASLLACKPASQKVQIGPFEADRYDATSPDGSKIDCYVFGADSNKPARLCGDPSPLPNFNGALFHAAKPADASRFVESIGAAS